jgi:hypothetical protein
MVFKESFPKRYQQSSFLKIVLLKFKGSMLISPYYLETMLSLVREPTISSSYSAEANQPLWFYSYSIRR